MDFGEFLEDLPLLHSWDGGQTFNTGGFDKQQLRVLIEVLRNRLPLHPSVLETGAGCSTIAFLFLNPSRIVSIDPNPNLFARIRSYCETRGIPTSILDCRVGASEWILPALAQLNDAEPCMDFVLIDGCHGLPTPFVDFFYANYMLRRDGYILVDDVRLASCRELVRLLIEQPGFELTLDIGKSTLFQKTTAARCLPDWYEQPYIARRSRPSGIMRAARYVLQPFPLLRRQMRSRLSRL